MFYKYLRVLILFHVFINSLAFILYYIFLNIFPTYIKLSLADFRDLLPSDVRFFVLHLTGTVRKIIPRRTTT